MNEEAQIKAIKEWLRMVDKPLGTKKTDNKGAELREESDSR